MPQTRMESEYKAVEKGRWISRDLVKGLTSFCEVNGKYELESKQ